MCTPVRKLLLPILASAALALALAGSAAAEPSPLKPAQPVTPNAQAMADVYWVVFGVALALFALVVLALGLGIARSWDRAALLPLRRLAGGGAPGDAAGEAPAVPVRRILFFAAIPLIGMVVVAVAAFAKLGDARDAPAAATGSPTVALRAEASQAGWLYTYPNGATSNDQLRVPVGALVKLTVAAADVQHAFWVPQIAGQVRVFPGEPRTVAFRVDRAGDYAGHSTVPAGPGDEKLGIVVRALPQGDYDDWVGSAAEGGS